MINNDVLRSIRYMHDFSENKIIEIVKMGNGQLAPDDLSAFLKKEDEEGFVECDTQTMLSFLAGLIILKRGQKESQESPTEKVKRPAENRITNNLILKRLRVAFELRDEDIIAMLEKVDFKINKTELSAFFRKIDHKNYRSCGDQFLRNFLKGLTKKIRKA
jgi:uncharacterized protein YehS (DUF1456 family)